MKRGYVFSTAALFFVALIIQTTSCSKSGSGTSDNACIERVIPQYTQTALTSGQIDSIKTLFGKNNMSTNQLQFIEYIPDIYTDTGMTPQAQVTANLFLNGLPVFNYNEVFVFNGGVFDTAYLYTGTPLTNDTTGHQTLAYLRSSFLKHVSESVTYSPISKPFVPSPNSYTGSCMVATMGYVDAVYAPGNTIPWGTLIKVWAVTPLNSGYPCVYVRDDNGVGWGVPLIIP